MSVTALINLWRGNPEISSNITAWKETPQVRADFQPLPASIPEELKTALNAQGIEALYRHQLLSWQASRRGEHVVISTGTASGKTLCYNLPILSKLLENPQYTALYLFPTKALAQDQEQALKQFFQYEQGAQAPLVGTYDGDTPSATRNHIREASQIVLSNPDMLHLGILPHHTRWAGFFRNLRYVVIDEMHVYRGVFGSHFANLIRRLKRIAAFYNARPQFFLTSATIANPEELADQLIEAPVTLISEDGSSNGKRHFILYNPPIIDPELGIRRGAISESVRLAGDLLAHDLQSILFSGSRRGVELTLTYLRRENELDPARIRGYRSGYLRQERRSIEKGLRDGHIRSVVATNALELGIDIGGLEAAILAGYPGSIAATRQQAGRAGRGFKASMAVLVASSNPLDQFLIQNPEYLFGRSPEHALIDPDNLLILVDHLRCAVFERPIRRGEPFGRLGPQTVEEILKVLEGAGDLHYSGEKFFWISDRYPAQSVSLRTASPTKILLQAGSEESLETIGEIDYQSAFWMAHPGAVYLHETRQYLVTGLDLEGNTAQVKEVELDYYTQAIQDSAVEIQNVLMSDAVSGGEKSYGEVVVTTQVTGFRRIQWETHERLDITEIDMPPTQLQTTAYWLSLAEATVTALQDQGLWNSQPNDYGPNWRDQRAKTLDRDRYRCQHCGKHQEGRSLHVHHKIPFRTFESYQAANRLSNLITLCPSCHRRAETVVRVRSSLAGMAYALSHLAPLYLMCDQRDLGVLSDPQSPISQGRPTIVIYDQIPAGIGLSQRLYEIHLEVVTNALALVQTCPCDTGCPSCVGPPGEAGYGGKTETRALLEALVP